MWKCKSSQSVQEIGGEAIFWVPLENRSCGYIISTLTPLQNPKSSSKNCHAHSNLDSKSHESSSVTTYKYDLSDWHGIGWVANNDNNGKQ